MSIIHDALKKVQEKNAKQTPPAPVKEPSGQKFDPQAPDAAVATETHKPLTILFLGTLCIAVVIVFAILWNVAKGAIMETAPAKTFPAPEVQSIAAPASESLVPDAPARPPAPTSESLATGVLAPAPTPAPQIDPDDPLSSLRIEGIMDMGSKRVALINGNIYEEGQTIYGKIIASIMLDSVTIVDDGKKRIFPVSPPRP